VTKAPDQAKAANLGLLEVASAVKNAGKSAGRLGK